MKQDSPVDFVLRGRIRPGRLVFSGLILQHVGHGGIGVRGDISYVDRRTVHFREGSSADYDLIMLATGYPLRYPFIDRDPRCG